MDLDELTEEEVRAALRWWRIGKLSFIFGSGVSMGFVFSVALDIFKNGGAINVWDALIFTVNAFELGFYWVPQDKKYEYFRDRGFF